MPEQSSLHPPRHAVVFAVATFDTKAEELAWVAACLRKAMIEIVTVDVSAARETDAADAADVGVPEVLAASGLTLSDVQSRDRGGAVTSMSDAFRIWLLQEHAKGRVAGVIGIGGSGGTAIVTAGMRALPVGIPKLMVSTMASGNTAPYVDCSDICLMPSIVDVAGLNTVSRRVLSNAAHAMAGMVTHVVPETVVRPAIGMTMFGVTTTCVTAVRKSLEDAGFDCLVFHATGTGGRAMEKLVESGLIEGVLDVTTTEVADEVVGGILTAGPQRFDVILQKQIPYVMSLGALDMVNFGAKETVPDRFRNRTLHVHNANVTLMRTTAEENRQVAKWIAAKLNQSSSAVTLLIPEQGVSAIDAAGQPFHDPAADAVLFDQLESLVEQSELRRVVRFPQHVNDPEFARALVDEFLRLWDMRRT